METRAMKGIIAVLAGTTAVLFVMFLLKSMH